MTPDGPSFFEKLLGTPGPPQAVELPNGTPEGGTEDATKTRDERIRALIILLLYLLIGWGTFLALRVVTPLILGITDVLTPFIMAFILAYILNPVLRRAQQLFSLTRAGVVAITYVFFGGLILLVFSLLIPLLVEQGRNLYDMADAYVEESRLERQTAQLREDARVIVPVPVDMGDGSTSGTMIINAPADAVTTEALQALALGDQITSPTTKVSASTFMQEDPSRGQHMERRRPLGAWLSGARESAEELYEELLPRAVDYVQKRFSFEDNELGNTAASVLAPIWSVIGFTIFLSFVVVIAFYMLVDYASLVETFWQAVPLAYHDRTAIVLAKIDYSVGGFLRGQLLICCVVGIMWTTWLSAVMGLYRYALLVGSIAGSMNFIPYLGPSIGFIGAGFYVLLSPVYEGWVSKLTGIGLGLAGLTIIQAIEGMVLQPKLIGPRAQLHPLLIILALLAGSQFGFAGMLLAVPMACIIKAVWTEFVWDPYCERQMNALRAEAEISFARRAMRLFEKTQQELAEQHKSAPAVDNGSDTHLPWERPQPTLMDMVRGVMRDSWRRLVDPQGTVRSGEAIEQRKRPTPRADDERVFPAVRIEEERRWLDQRRAEQALKAKGTITGAVKVIPPKDPPLSNGEDDEDVPTTAAAKKTKRHRKSTRRGPRQTGGS